jgi:4-aminobutyrate aminotransferase-like enzyme
LAVLEVLQAENLQVNALTVGKQLLSELGRLQTELEIIGDVRGIGFFLGIELVHDHESRTPATDQARFVANRLREMGVLIGTDGPDHNVLKIRPPMCFARENATQLVSLLKDALQELPRFP